MFSKVARHIALGLGLGLALGVGLGLRLDHLSGDATLILKTSHFFFQGGRKEGKAERIECSLVPRVGVRVGVRVRVRSRARVL